MTTITTSALARRAEIGRERRLRTEQKLVEAAARVIAVHGESAATIDDFISEAGVARGTFYNYFTTKGALMEALWARIGRDPFAAVQQACNALDDPAESLSAELRLVLLQSARDPVWGWLVYALSSAASTLNDELRAFPRPSLIAGLESGRFAFDDLDAASDLVVGAIRLAMQGVLNGDRPAGYGSELARMILTALALDKQEAARLASLPLPRVEISADASRNL